MLEKDKSWNRFKLDFVSVLIAQTKQNQKKKKTKTEKKIARKGLHKRVWICKSECYKLVASVGHKIRDSINVTMMHVLLSL